LAEKQRSREAEKQRSREAEKQRSREAEKQRILPHPRKRVKYPVAKHPAANFLQAGTRVHGAEAEKRCGMRSLMALVYDR
ncbi:hypothetical protein, partial [Treponema socranskii]|uniref:hypothetical protein n=1 Tax=Treponema socranskii TaxID=53419 RepID=UPI000571DDE0